MTKEDLRNRLILELRKALEEQPKGYTQMSRMVDIIREDIRNNNIPPNEQWNLHHRVFEIVHEWYRAGLIFWGMADDPNSGFPWFTITNFGKDCLEKDNILPYDPDGYINELMRQNPSLDNITLSYVQESVATYNTNNLLSSTITLGVASENLILILIESFIDSISNSSSRLSLENRISRLGISSKYEEFKKELNKYMKKLPQNLTKDLEIYLDQVFQFIRMNRNQTGHPTGKAVSKKIAQSNLQIFAEYSVRIFQLINFFKNNKI